MSDHPEENGSAKKIRVITEPGGFGVPAHMVIVRKWREGKVGQEINVESYIVAVGSKNDQLEECEKMKQQVIVDPLFCSFTILEFVSETRPLQEKEESDEPKIIRPTFRDTKRFNRSKYLPKSDESDG